MANISHLADNNRASYIAMSGAEKIAYTARAHTHTHTLLVNVYIKPFRKLE